MMVRTVKLSSYRLSAHVPMICPMDD